MKTINEVTQALSADRYQWPTAPTTVTQVTPDLVEVEVDLHAFRTFYVRSFMSQFRVMFNPLHTDKGGYSGRVRVGAIDVDLIVRANIKES